jgi:hypothetical protein
MAWYAVIDPMCEVVAAVYGRAAADLQVMRPQEVEKRLAAFERAHYRVCERCRRHAGEHAPQGAGAMA